MNASCEKIKIVFEIGNLTREGSRLDNGEFNFNDVKAIKIISLILKNEGITSSFRENSSAKYFSLEEYALMITRDKRNWTRVLEGGGMKIQFGWISSYNQCFISVEETEPGAAGNWDEWVKYFSFQKNFIQAWVMDVEYDKWQNASDFLEYEAAERSYEGLPIRSNGLPPPLENFEIDISNNPGRTVIKDGYVEAIGAKMWFGELIWRKMRCDAKITLERLNFIDKSFSFNGVTKIIVCSRGFCKDEDREIQDSLREILFA